MHLMRSWKPELLPLLLVLLAGCGEPLAEERQFTELVDRISGDYLDNRGNDKLKAAALLRGFYLRNKSVHLLVRIESIALPSPEHAVATIYVAMGQRGSETLPDADVFRIELELVADGDSYEILQTRWQRASAADVIF